MWDPACTPSSLQGVTTVLGGNCGFSIAPMTPKDAAYLLPMLARVEGMSLASLEAGLDLGWDSFGSWLDRLDGNVAVNAGFSAGHSSLRRAVMGEDAVGGTATVAQMDAMITLLRRSLDEGALGFSSSWGGAHNDHRGDPVPSRFADEDELIALASVAGEFPGTALEFIPSISPGYGAREYRVMTAMAGAAGRPLNWNLVLVRPGEREREQRESKVAAFDHAAAAGATVVGLALPEPMRMRLSFATAVLYDTLPGWADVMHLPVPARMDALRRPDVRARLATSAAEAGPRNWTDWASAQIRDVADPALAHQIGRTAGQIAAETGTSPFDALLDLVLADGLATGIDVPITGDDDASWTERVELLRDPRVVVGASDAGAHLDMVQTFGCYTSFLAEAVRDRGLLPLEEAIRLITDLPARLYGLRDRGRIAVGAHADLLVLDPARIGPGDYAIRTDLPAGGWRITGEATGIAHTFVNGVEIAHDGVLTGAVPGTVLRGGRDTAARAGDR
jgi:N-acyl-D-aspartate/D-glutamate deacylase